MPLDLPAPTAALLDLDGTLVNTLGDFCEALQRMLRDLPAPYASFSVTVPLVEPLVGKGSENLIKSLLELVNSAGAAPEIVASHISRPGASAVFDLALARYQHHYAEVNGQQAEVYDGVQAGLEGLRALGWPLACVTNKPTGFAQDLLRAKGLAGFFEFTLGGDALPRKKPDPLPLQVACQRLGREPAQVLMVGDSSNDAQAARAAGCPVWLMTYGYNHGQPIQQVDADGFADSLTELPWL
ncbi:MAG: phosphoglycolate phosphatase [Burkholderiales bacterium PBB4]|nr:MAG: phosphoglycolate phosphatase [Burkholderiales bacterium PBB4]